ncbi:MAG: hypothetical protein IKP21_08485 [Bacteroidales bacterium]|nr:hypothetical protein [Bacteroidales bacterium]
MTNDIQQQPQAGSLRTSLRQMTAGGVTNDEFPPRLAIFFAYFLPVGIFLLLLQLL